VRAAALVVATIATACQAGAPPGPLLQVVGESTRLRADEPLPIGSPFFDGRELTLRAARGEILGVLVLRAVAGDSEIGLRVDGALVRAYRVDELTVARASTDMYGPSRGRGRYPDRLEPATPASGPVVAGRAAFFDVEVAIDASPGDHDGELVVDGARYPVHLRVEPITLPPLGAHPRVWAYYDAREIARADGIAPGTDAAWQAERRYAAMFRRYGVMATPELTLDDADRRAEAVAGARFVPILLPSGRAAIEATARAWATRLARTDQIGFAIPIDEPKRVGDQLQARAIADWVHAAAGDRVWLAVTDRPGWPYADAPIVFISPEAPGTGPVDQRWTYNGAPPIAGSMILDTDGVALRTWGWIAYRWRVPLWYVWEALYWSDRYGQARVGGHSVLAPLTDLDRDAITYDDGEDRGNLDGVLAYPGVRPSLRLAALRRGLEDRALLDALETCAGRDAADTLARALVPTALGPGTGRSPPVAGSWPIEEGAWEAGRQRTLDALIACNHRRATP